MSSLDTVIENDTNPVTFEIEERRSRFSLIPKSKRKLSILLIYMIGFSEGLLYLSNLAIYYMFKEDFGLSPAQLSLIYTIPAVPYVIRPGMGYLTDTVPIFGTRRRHYLILNSLVQSLSFFSLALFPVSLFISTVFLFLITFSIAFCMTIAEALVVENISYETDNLSGFVAMKAFSSLFVCYFSGSLLEKYPKQFLFFITGFFPLLITFYAFFIKEENENIVYESHPVKDLFKFLREPVIFRPCVFLFLVVMTPAYEDAFVYYVIDVLGYSPSFMGLLRLIYGVSIIIGIGVFRLFFKNVSIRNLLFWSTLFVNIVYTFPALITSGLTDKFGIPNKPLVLCGSFLMEAAFEIQVMPFLTYSTKVTPKGLEASVFAAIMTIKSIGIFACKLLTSLSMYLFGIDNHKYEHLTSYILFCTACALAIMVYLKKVPNKEEMELFISKHKMTHQTPDKV